MASVRKESQCREKYWRRQQRKYGWMEEGKTREKEKLKLDEVYNVIEGLKPKRSRNYENRRGIEVFVLFWRSATMNLTL